MKIERVEVFPVSHRMPDKPEIRIGVGRMVKRDAVLVKVTSNEGISGWGEAHHGRSPGAIAKLIETTLAPMLIGHDALDAVGVWSRLHRGHLASHGFGAGTAIAMSGIDMAVWDLRGKAAGWPLYKLLGGGRRPIKAYGGGLSLGYQEPASLLEEARKLSDGGYKALKLRIGDRVDRDIARIEAVREGLGKHVALLSDANTAYTIDDVRTISPVLKSANIGWLEEPFSPYDHHAYARAAQICEVPIAAGENHYTRFEFDRLLDERAVQVIQPDISKSGGITEVMRIAAMASARNMSVNPHSSMTALNMAASLHLLSAVDNPGYFEADVSVYNLFRTEFAGPDFTVDDQGFVYAPEGAGLGVEVDEEFVRAHALIEGPCYV
ncbi:mandelate racemase/muconate lactonizing enzyme family protein [Rhodobacteraceae bacterium 2CG4]|uniref:Mandelate racemase/muconate lactonizing enzyme family protein n=1 Tax=Halovulum marinum TaxID=2662447 RepID=A0A6L5Z2Z3_9RHOB|nr:mandelate racemase/muconate lactonizing enzyme family protein [Halovulum marinum]MSU90897.1 mandelate racemase/muconate lactonizing enzyme family protein [Halovulum marinum]